MIGVTGATGRLGQAIAELTPIIPIGRTMPTERIPVIIHAATIRGRSQADADDFQHFNTALTDYCDKHDPLVVNIGSCWQILPGTCREQPYTRLKNAQESMLPQARHVIPYWIYGPQKGFIHDLKTHLQGGTPLTHAGTEPRDFIHVHDVARAALTAASLPPGRYAVATGQPLNPHELATGYGIHLTIREDPITATLAYPLPFIGRPTITVHDYLTGRYPASSPNATERNHSDTHSQATTRTATPNPTASTAG